MNLFTLSLLIRMIFSIVALSANLLAIHYIDRSGMGTSPLRYVARALKGVSFYTAVTLACTIYGLSTGIYAQYTLPSILQSLGFTLGIIIEAVTMTSLALYLIGVVDGNHEPEFGPG